MVDKDEFILNTTYILISEVAQCLDSNVSIRFSNPVALLSAHSLLAADAPIASAMPAPAPAIAAAEDRACWARPPRL